MPWADENERDEAMISGALSTLSRDDRLPPESLGGGVGGALFLRAVDMVGAVALTVVGVVAVVGAEEVDDDWRGRGRT